MFPIADRIHEEIISRFGLEAANTSHLPMQQGFKSAKETDHDHNADNTQYRSIIGSLLYLGITTRPDIVYAVCTLVRYVQCPKNVHMTAAKRIVKYVKGTREWGLFIRRRSYPCASTDPPLMVKLDAYTDASFNDDPDTSRSTLAYVVRINENPISWKSKLPSTVPQSAMESELIALHTGVREITWCRYLLQEMLNLKLPATHVYCDNAPCIDLVTSAKVTDRSKHIKPKFSLVRDLIKNNEIAVVKIIC
jgi:RNase H.